MYRKCWNNLRSLREKYSSHDPLLLHKIFAVWKGNHEIIVNCKLVEFNISSIIPVSAGTGTRLKKYFLTRSQRFFITQRQFAAVSYLASYSVWRWSFLYSWDRSISLSFFIALLKFIRTGCIMVFLRMFLFNNILVYILLLSFYIFLYLLALWPFILSLTFYL